MEKGAERDALARPPIAAARAAATLRTTATLRAAANALSARCFDHPLAVSLVLAGIGAFLLGTLRQGQDWDGDFALYLMNTENIVQGAPYARTGYWFNPGNPINPVAYPPGLPLLLAPIYVACGMCLPAMKILCTLCFVAFLAVFQRIARRYLAPPAALLTVAALGLQPFIWDFHNSVYSEFPFMLFAYTALMAFEQLRRAEQKRATLALLGIAGACLAAAYLTRPIGALLVPAALIPVVYQPRRLLHVAVATACAALIVALVQREYPPDTGTYLGYFHEFGPGTILASARQYLRVLQTLPGVSMSLPPVAAGVLKGMLLGLITVGFVQSVRKAPAVYDWFFLFYACFLLLYPISLEPERYSLPIWPMLFLYAACGLRWVFAQLHTATLRVALGAVLAGGLVGSYALAYERADFGAVRYAVEAPESRELFAAIQRIVPEQDAVMARKPTIIALYGKRRATIWPERPADSSLWQFIGERKIRYIVQDLQHLGVKRERHDVLDEFIAENRSHLALEFSNAWFNLYRLPSQESFAAKLEAADRSDTFGAGSAVEHPPR